MKFVAFFEMTWTMEIKYFADIRTLTGINEQRWTGETSTLRSLLKELAIQHGTAFEKRILEGDRISGSIIILVNGRHVEHLNGLETRLSPEDVVAIFPMVAGG